jgi:hypothetical protein
VAASVLLACAGCGDFPTIGSVDDPPADSQEDVQLDTVAPLDTVEPLDAVEPASPAPVATGALPYDDEFVVEEGVWYPGEADTFPEIEGGFKGQSNGLLGAGAPGGVWIDGPALYGKYAVRIEAFDSRPPVPAWCADVVEVSYDHPTAYLSMGSFESWADPLPLDPGTYRIRYCASGLDATVAETAEDEFDGDDYRLYSSRHLFQLWPAPSAPDEVVRTTSEFAAAEHARVAGGGS